MKDLKEFAQGLAMAIIIPLAMALLVLLFGEVIEVHAETDDLGELSLTYSYNADDYTKTEEFYYNIDNGVEYDFVAFYQNEVYDTYTCKSYVVALISKEIPTGTYTKRTINTKYDSVSDSTSSGNLYNYTYTSSSGQTYYIHCPYSGSSDYSDGVYTSTFGSKTIMMCVDGYTSILNGSSSSWIKLLDIYESYEPPTTTYSSNIPTPQVVLDQLGKIGFNNKTDDYYIEMQGRWRTAQDIDIFTENLVWKYKFQSRIDSDLTTWVSQDDRLLATADDLYITQLGADNFATLLSVHPPMERNIYTSNSLGEFLSGFAHQKGFFIDYLNIPGYFAINSPEIYVRYYTVDDASNVEYGKWCHAYITMPTSGKMKDLMPGEIVDGQDFVSTQSDKGLTEDELTYVEDLEDTRLETDATISNNSDGSVYVPNAQMDTSQLLNVLTSMFEQSKAFFDLFAQVFSFFPEWLTGLIFSSLGVMVLIGLWKFWRG